VGLLVSSGLTYTLKVENSCRSRGAGMHRRCIRRADTQRRCLKGGQVLGLRSSDSRPARRAFRWAHLFVQVCPGSECPTKTTSQTMPCWDGLDQPPPRVRPRSGQPPRKPLIFRCRTDQPQTVPPPSRRKEPWNISRCVYARSCIKRPVHASERITTRGPDVVPTRLRRTMDRLGRLGQGGST
jgi:hypothetical protein